MKHMSHLTAILAENLQAKPSEIKPAQNVRKWAFLLAGAFTEISRWLSVKSKNIGVAKNSSSAKSYIGPNPRLPGKNQSTEF